MAEERGNLATISKQDVRRAREDVSGRVRDAHRGRIVGNSFTVGDGTVRIRRVRRSVHGWV